MAIHTAVPGPLQALVINKVQNQDVLRVDWTPNAFSPDCNHKVVYNSSQRPEWKGKEVVVEKDINFVDITDLSFEVPAEYCVSVLAFNGQGHGPATTHCLRHDPLPGACMCL